MPTDRPQRPAPRAALWLVALALGPAVQRVAAQTPAVAAPAAGARAQAPYNDAAMERRLTLLTRELELTDPQRAAVRHILEEQRAQVLALWSDAWLPGAERVGRLRQVTDHTSDAIRAILTPEQRLRYNHPKPAPSIDADEHALTVWMDRLQAH